MTIDDTDGFFHLTYCTNIHPGETWEAVQQNLEQYLPPLKARLAPSRTFGVGLRLSDQAARTLLEGDHLARFRDWLDARGLYVFTINGFPYGGFHRQVVKDHVYAPDWRAQERVDYTLRLARILAHLVPDELDGGISTSPVSYKPWLDADGRREAFQVGSRHLAEVAAGLRRVYEETGRTIHVDLEPEPDCLVENTAETVAFFTDWLLPEGGRYLAEQQGWSEQEAQDGLLHYLRVCYDTCHLAVEYEAPTTFLNALREAGIKVGKVQISAALQVALPASAGGRDGLAVRLTPFAESTYLHQVVQRNRDGSFRHYADLTDALPHLAGAEADEWRIHYHVPLFVDDFNGLRSTQADIPEALHEILQAKSCRHLEIETYTWEVLPPALKLDVVDSIEREYRWVQSVADRRARIEDRG